MKTYSNSLMIFRQDLRVIDNIALYKAVMNSESVHLAFILDTDVLDHFPDDDQRLHFQADALTRLSADIAKLWGILHIYHGKASEITKQLIDTYAYDAVFWNRSHGAWSETRDVYIEEYCEQKGVKAHAYIDYLLLDPQEVKPMKVYTPYYNRWIPKVREKYASYELKNIESIVSFVPDVQLDTEMDLDKLYILCGWKSHTHWPIQDVRQKLDSMTMYDYDTTRNFPADTDGVTKLSPYHKFGILSIREIYLHFADRTDEWAVVIVKELWRREFWNSIAYHFRDEFVEKEFQAKRRGIIRQNDIKKLEARKKWETGYPIVDAAMKQLLETNRMHNRVRMVVASFLTKDLLIDWRYGEEHFKNYLLDYDRNINIGNRQRSSSTWADPKPLRIFNPILQSWRYDPQADYIYTRIPELRWKNLKAIHDPIKYELNWYIAPIVDHYVERLKAKEMYNNAKARFLWESQE